MQRRWVFNNFSGARIRLDDAVVMSHLKLAGIKRKKREIIMGDLLVMETAALEVFNSAENKNG